MNGQHIQIADRQFIPFLSEKEIQEKIASLAEAIDVHYKGKELVLLAVLNGSFLFCSDLVRQMQCDASISFIRVKSYFKTQSSGRVDEVLGIHEDLKDKHVLVVEDIVDTGTTIDKLLKIIQLHQPASVEVCSLLFKKDAFLGTAEMPKFIGFSIPNLFVVGYGLDYMEKGRKLKEIYQIVDSVKGQ